MSNLLKEVTFKTIKKFNQTDIIMPSDYKSIFSKYAKEQGVDLEDKETILDELKRDETRINHLVNETNNNLTMLQNSAKTAQIAIQNKDEDGLKMVQNDVKIMQDQIQFLQNELFTDSLTKAKNRKWFSDFYLKEDKFPNIGFLAFIDLNNFKIINDTYGHITGDQVLRYLSAFLQKELTTPGISVIRYAGDEFMILFDNMKLDEKKLLLKLDAVQQKLSEQKLKSKTIDNLSFSFSYGLTSFERFSEFAEIIEIADERMYKNKQKMKSLKK